MSTHGFRDGHLELVPDVIQAFTSSLYEANLKSGPNLATDSHEKIYISRSHGKLWWSLNKFKLFSIQHVNTALSRVEWEWPYTQIINKYIALLRRCVLGSIFFLLFLICCALIHMHNNETELTKIKFEPRVNNKEQYWTIARTQS